jgi:hypothetical protein
MSLVWTMTLGGSLPELLKHLLDELGVDEDDEFAIQLKVKQKVSNLNRTRREFMEMVAEDDMGDVRSAAQDRRGIWQEAGRIEP